MFGKLGSERVVLEAGAQGCPVPNNLQNWKKQNVSVSTQWSLDGVLAMSFFLFKVVGMVARRVVGKRQGFSNQ